MNQRRESTGFLVEDESALTSSAFDDGCASFLVSVTTEQQLFTLCAKFAVLDSAETRAFVRESYSRRRAPSVLVA